MQSTSISAKTVDVYSQVPVWSKIVLKYVQASISLCAATLASHLCLSKQIFPQQWFSGLPLSICIVLPYRLLQSGLMGANASYPEDGTAPLAANSAVANKTRALHSYYHQAGRAALD